MKAQEPVAWVDERAISWLADHRNRAGANITTQLVPNKSFERPMPLYAAPPPAAAEIERLRALLKRALPMVCALDATQTAVVWTADLQVDATNLRRDIRAALERP